MEITWESLKFDCAPRWNPDEHCYDEWESTENPITVTNTTKSGAPVLVTLTFVPVDKMGATAVFAPCEDDPHPEDFTFSNGQVTFLLPRDAHGEAQATVNLFLTGDPMNRETHQYNQIGSIKTEITPITPSPEPEPPIVARPAEKPPAPAEPAPTQPSQPEPPAEPSQPPPPAAEGQPPLTKTEKPEPEGTPEAMPPPKQNSKEEIQTAPHAESGAPPQEEPQ